MGGAPDRPLGRSTGAGPSPNGGSGVAEAKGSGLLAALDLAPLTSIASEVVVAKGAYLVPPVVKRNWVVEAGLFDALRQPIGVAQGWHFPRRAATEFPTPPAENAPLLPGHYFYAGHYVRQFGQFLLETTARLWHLDQHPARYDGMIVLAQPDVDRAKVAQTLQGFMALCGWQMPPLLWPDTPVRLETVTIPKQGSGALELMLAAPEYRDMIHNRFARHVAPHGAERIYISRTGFKDPHGSLAEEARLEALLQAEGYEPFHPQDHSLEAQIAAYKAARVVVAVDGSALHLLAMVLRADQRVVVVQRRPAPEAQMQAAQLRLFSGAEVSVIDAEPSGWSPAGVRRSALSVFGVLNFEHAGQALARMGLIARPELWTASPPEALRARLKQIGQELDADMYEVDRPGIALTQYKKRSHASQIRLYSHKRQQRMAAKP